MHFQRFLSFILARQQASESCTLDNIFKFLTAYSKVAPKFSSLTSASTAIKWFLKKSPKEDLVKDPRWSTFLKGMKRLCAGPVPKCQVWNRHRVPDRIASSPKPTGLIAAGGEAAVLIMLATCSRLSDIVKLRAYYEKMDFGVRLFLFSPRKSDLRKQFVAHIDVAFFFRKINAFARLARFSVTSG
jgi:hypothetical protein